MDFEGTENLSKRERVARKSTNSEKPNNASKQVAVSPAEARRLIVIIEKSQVPFGESAPVFAKIKAQVDAGKPLSGEDQEHLLDLVKKAKDWEKAVESSAMTQPEETLPG
jgi:hypothetical protein